MNCHLLYFMSISLSNSLQLLWSELDRYEQFQNKNVLFYVITNFASNRDLSFSRLIFFPYIRLSNIPPAFYYDYYEDLLSILELLNFIKLDFVQNGLHLAWYLLLQFQPVFFYYPIQIRMNHIIISHKYKNIWYIYRYINIIYPHNYFYDKND
jgi:hypothetical protein